MVQVQGPHLNPDFAVDHFGGKGDLLDLSEIAVDLFTTGRSSRSRSSRSSRSSSSRVQMGHG